MPGEAQVSQSARLPAIGDLPLNSSPAVDVGPGQTVKVEIGGLGRPVVGKVAQPVSSAKRIDLATASGILGLKQSEMPSPEGFMNWDQEKRYAYSKRWYLSAEGKAHRRSGRLFMFPIGPDGSFRIADVLPGKYELVINVGNTPGFQTPSGWGNPCVGKTQTRHRGRRGIRWTEPTSPSTSERWR